MTVGLLAWIMLGALLGLIGTARPWVPVAGCGAALFLLPGAATLHLFGISYVFGGGLPTLHPATWLIASAAGTLLITRPASLRESLRLVPATALVLLMAGIALALVSTLGLKVSSQSQFIEQFIAPLLWLLLCLSAYDRRPLSRSVIYRALIALTAVVAFLGIAQLLFQRTLIFEAGYAEYAIRYGKVGIFRSPSTLDHPLIASMVLTAALPLVMNHGMGVFSRIALVLSLAIAIVATGSRAGSFIALAYMSFALLRDVVHGRFGRAVLLAPIGCTAVWLAADGPAQEALGRIIGGDASSTAVRMRAADVMGDVLADHLFLGSGAGTSFELSHQLLGGGISFENPTIMMIADYGLIAVIAWHVGWLLLIAHGSGQRKGAMFTSAILMILAAQTFSSYGVRSQVPLLIATFIACALMVQRGEAQRPVGDGKNRATPARAIRTKRTGSKMREAEMP